MKRVFIFLALIVSVCEAAADTRIISVKIRGGTRNPDGSLTYNRVDVVKEQDGYHVKCLGGGVNSCIVPTTVDQGSSDVDAYDLQIANQMIIEFHRQLAQGNANGTITKVFTNPDAVQRNYQMNWVKVLQSDGEIEYEMQLIRR